MVEQRGLRGGREDRKGKGIVEQVQPDLPVFELLYAMAAAAVARFCIYKMM